LPRREEPRVTDPRAAEQTEEPEEVFVLRAISGDKIAFTQLYDVHYDRVYRHVLYRVPSSEDAEDLTQLVFLQAWRAIGRYQVTGTPFIAWLFTIAHNLIMSFYRRNKLTTPLEGDTQEHRSDGDPEHWAEARFDQERIRRAITQLRPEHQQVITLRFLENLPHRDIAEALGKTEGAIRVIQHRALIELRRILQREQRA
jgi:RNA polymerase sigma-70 factor (ECF subfamily)